MALEPWARHRIYISQENLHKRSRKAIIVVLIGASSSPPATFPTRPACALKQQGRGAAFWWQLARSSFSSGFLAARATFGARRINGPAQPVAGAAGDSGRSIERDSFRCTTS